MIKYSLDGTEEPFVCNMEETVLEVLINREEKFGYTDSIRQFLIEKHNEHLEDVINRFLAACEPACDPVSRDGLQKLVDVRDHAESAVLDPVAFGKSIMEIDTQISWCLPTRKSPDAVPLMSELRQTAKYFAQDKRVMWVRGPIDLLNETTVRPWQV